METFSKEQRRAAESLAVRYHAFKRAHLSGDWEGAITWADMLAETQRETGVELETPEFLEWVTRIARREAVNRRMCELEDHEGFDGWPGDRWTIQGIAAGYFQSGKTVDAAVDLACEYEELRTSGCDAYQESI